MSGLDAVIARVDAIESQIVSLDPAARAADAAAVEATPETAQANATTFAEVLDAAKSGSGVETTDPSAVSGAVGETGTGGTDAELLSALQTLFSAGSAGSSAVGGSASSMQKLIEMIG
ncbi:hypothetical protein [Microbacterium sp.]|uniref:hypothetical protein n=1 Tax=Microbacterium sp. TaxID=51671 RepID=UPI003567F4A4